MSKFFPEPDFQQGLPQPAQSELANHRGLPDIAADADVNTGMVLYINGQWSRTQGTSSSAPLWAALVAIANQMAGHPLGFINPGLYKLGLSASARKDFRDITSGNNSINADTLPIIGFGDNRTNQGPINVKGFQATNGWDAITGWGAPQASQLLPDLIAALL